ncbi:hypothetical protein C8R44DRAFT_854560 [Mycena epipterygia]|nr:hypothetical protein C8R44DRAFT_854560 [Mycena epipterygia]
MSSFSESSLSWLASSPPTSTTTKFMVGALIFALAAGVMHYTSPMRLTEVLSHTLAEAEHSYFEGIEAGMLSASDVDTEVMLSRLQIKVSGIREATLRNTLSMWKSLREYSKGRTITVLRCIWEAQKFKTDIEYISEILILRIFLDDGSMLSAGCPPNNLKRRRQSRTSSIDRSHGHHLPQCHHHEFGALALPSPELDPGTRTSCFRCALFNGSSSESYLRDLTTDHDFNPQAQGVIATATDVSSDPTFLADSVALGGVAKARWSVHEEENPGHTDSPAVCHRTSALTPWLPKLWDKTLPGLSFMQ